MAATDELTTNCVVNDSPQGQRKAGSGPTGCKGLKSMRRLMALGLSAGEVEGLGLDRQTLRTICEYARLDGREDSRPSAEDVETMLRILEAETRACEMEQEMLGLRKRALHNRVRLLGKLGHLLARTEADPLR